MAFPVAGFLHGKLDTLNKSNLSMQMTNECLIIDDDQDDQEIFLMCLGDVSKDVSCTARNNGVDALAMLTTDSDYTPAYIFIDVNMPKMNGIECLKELKNIERLKNTKIFMYSTTSESTAFARSKELGATDFIIKPSSTFDLKAKLSEIFEVVTVNPPTC
jgi:CheY-like chemotaxis protein